MPLNDDQKRTLLVNLARDKAEHLRNEIARLAEQAKKQDHSGLTPQQRALGEAALQRAMESIQRVVDNVEAAMALSEKMAQEGGGPAPPDGPAEPTSEGGES